MTTETTWLTTADGKVHFPVLKAFTFLMPLIHKRADGVERHMPNERRFEKGDHVLDPTKEVDQQVLAHPWISRDFADGAIEAPHLTRARLEREAADAKAQQERRAALLADAAASLARSTVTSESAAVSGAAVEDELNTPLNQPKKARVK
jgi:hypothetical protein